MDMASKKKLTKKPSLYHVNCDELNTVRFYRETDGLYMTKDHYIQSTGAPG